ncbi:alkaline phosphatase family protein [Bacillus glycinifermentans]|uniref:alkaline phosphatase family protein n=1 Tax=Bacillus glycinifermentans TaxID=1664069 RepID=UPI002DB69DC3|nr:alkaline phosphatase family protein [Bacillus glycinifermentans]MEC0493314.1 alkaline phosphatase family protein [Bacillus glycinifermentans]MEC0541483.1 alkaline phosphatase family protein [Bacillus glycinifermentans]
MEAEDKKKSVIMLLIDSLMHEPLSRAIKSGQAPAMKFLLENGHYEPDVISPFPTMSVTVDSSLLTGVYSDRHKVPALVWFNKKENRIINYGSHIRELIKLGIKQSSRDIFYNLNQMHLNQQVKTIHEELAENGIETCSINALMHRGSRDAYLHVPALASWVTGLNHTVKINAPQLFSYGGFSKINPGNLSLLKKFGFNDRFTANELRHLIRLNQVPPLVLAYFPDLDQHVHKNGRNDVKGVAKADSYVQRILNSFRSWEDALKQNIWIVLGDNGQSWISEKKQVALIDLRGLLDRYRIVKLKKGVTSDDQIVLAVNERMAFIYTLDQENLPLQQVAEQLKEDERIDIIAWKNEKNAIEVISGEGDGKLIFKQGGDRADEYGQSWTLEGDGKVLDLTVAETSVAYGKFPNALARLYSSCFSHEGDYLIVSAKPGCEFIGEGSPTHIGGASHGALHEQDSLVSMIIAGTDSRPKYKRIVDVKEWIKQIVESQSGG